MSAGTAYTKRYGGGFINLPTTTTPIDSAFLNAVEAALREIYAVPPSADGQVMQWDNASTRIGPALLLNKNVDPAAAIAYSKLALGTSIVNADIAGAAAIAYSKLSLANQVVNADIAAGAAIAASKLAAYPTDVTKALKGDGTWAKVPTVTYALTSNAPASPGDGDIWIAVDSLTLATYQWMFRWNNGSSNTDKWEFVGGPPQRTFLSTSENVASAAYVDLATVVSLTNARAGVYDIYHGADSTTDGGTGTDSIWGAIKLGAAATADAESWINAGKAAAPATMSRTLYGYALAASTVLKQQYKSSNATARAISKRWIALTPVRVS